MTIIGFLAGGLLMVLWLRSEDDVKVIFKRVKNRIKE